jgi:hypothetical protein
VVERFSRTPDAILYEYTVDDPKMYVRLWTHKRELKALTLSPGIPEIIEYNCSEIIATYLTLCQPTSSDGTRLGDSPRGTAGMPCTPCSFWL